MNREKVDQLLVSGINWAYSGLLFFLPLFMWTTASEVFEFPKMLLVYVMTVAILGMWLTRMAINQKILIAKTPLDIPILLFLLSQTISTFYSIEPHTSWWGYYSRFHGGLMSTICYTLLYYGFVSNGQKAANSQRYGSSSSKEPYLIIVLFSGLLVAIYAVLQHFGIDQNFWVQDVMNRVFSTQGQPNWLAAQMVMVIPLFFIAVTDNDYKRYKSYNRLYWGGLAVCFLALLWSKSRSGLIGALVADGVFWGLALLKLQITNYKLSQPRRRSRHTGQIIRQFIYFHLILTGLILVTNNPARGWLQKLATKSETFRGGIAASSDQGTESGDIRKIVWEGAGELIRRYPLFGTGPETFAYTYWWVRPMEHNYTSEWNFLYNKAHNEWLNLAANTGLFGLGSHLLLLGWFTIWGLKNILNSKLQDPNRKQAPRSKSQINNYWNLEFGIWSLIAALAAIWGVEVVNILGFSTVTTGAYTYLFMAFAINQVKSEKLKVKSYQTKISKKLSLREIGEIGAIGIIGGYFLIQVFIMFIADLGYNKGKQYADAGYAEEALPILTNVVQLMPDEPVFREELAEAQAVTYGKMAVENFEIVRKQNPYHIPFLRSQGKYIFALGEADNSLYERGIELTLQSIKLAPTDPRGYYQLGVFYGQLGDNDRARKNYQKALELKADWAEAREKLKAL